MARANIVSLSVGRASVEPTPTALTVANGGSFVADGSEILKLSATGTVTVTIPTVAGNIPAMDTIPAVIRDRVVTLSAGQTHYVRVENGSFVQPTGVVHVDVSAAGVSAVVLRRGLVDVGYAPVAG
ncbi:hypothetical protein ABZT45_36470 [Streptomyces sp. NPDC005356]|uniref:hypothetical protein n=1 Tax=Streptomyces sp. NPDC005356 TaxID=3157167 RepID=UPI0033A1A971